MADDDPRKLMDVLSAPLGDLVAQVGLGVAEAQRALDTQAMDTFRAIYAGEDGACEALRAAGYRPAFYQIPECTAEIQVALSMSGQGSSGGGGSGGGRKGVRLYAAPVDATYANSYGFNIQASSKLSFRIVPVPPPAALDGQVPVPTATGRTLKEARALLASAGLGAAPDDDTAADGTPVRGQDPAAGTLVAEGTVVSLVTKT
jgi:hypothetical protein